MMKKLANAKIVNEQMSYNEENIVLKLSFEFACEIIKFCEKLDTDRKFHISNQLFRSGTSVGANIREAQNAESVNDFIHKIKITAKEMEESKYWLELCIISYNSDGAKPLHEKAITMSKIINKIIATSKNKINNVTIAN